MLQENLSCWIQQSERGKTAATPH